MPEDVMQFFRNFFRQKNLRFTETRARIIEWIINCEEHFTAEDIQKWVILNDLQIGRATIYRTLALLTKHKFLVRRDFSKNKSHYELIFNNEPHEHMICLNCGDIYEFKNKKIEKLLQNESAEIGFETNFHNIKIYGVCRDCQKQKDKS